MKLFSCHSGKKKIKLFFIHHQHFKKYFSSSASIRKGTAIPPRSRSREALDDGTSDASRKIRRQHFAGRHKLGKPTGTTVSIDGIHHVRMIDGNREETLVVGAACSTIFSGSNLHSILERGYEFEKNVMDSLSRGDPAPCLSVHTSAGTTPALNGFLHAFQPHLPWRKCGDDDDNNNNNSEEEEDDDWLISLQVEGASAVWAACDLLFQLQQERGRGSAQLVAVGNYSYHGPQSTSLGSGLPLLAQKPKNQIGFPVPAYFSMMNNESKADFHDRLLKEFDEFLYKHADDIGVMLVEPQWGSSVAAMPWPKELLKEYIKRARNKGILVCCDEIMCGLGRHGQGPAMFLSDSKVWDLDPDAVTFGKAIGGGVYPLSGVALKSGAKELQLSSRSTFQMHTYTGAQTRALMAGEAVCDALPDWYEHIAEMGIVLEEIAKDISDASNGTMVVHGHGMMWGGLFVHDIIDERLKAVSTLKEKCKNVWPYFVPSGGFMITPPIDTNEQDLREVGNRLCRAVEETEKVMRSV